MGRHARVRCSQNTWQYRKEGKEGHHLFILLFLCSSPSCAGGNPGGGKGEERGGEVRRGVVATVNIM